ncbi:SPX domain-containing protein [Radiomyces spectabilis]|uniref:SPX domain-containing protein n=1 Tax=Radiomyces spectabilis TaxID=64574 RepID=UPI00222004BB|nr:SPX domain-containing protein [Radiomyces spectabilis]KAI8391361.1 SPX domain-containing protein [Radiomyces spectabilis]
MKFAKQLETHSVPEWRKAYINYKGLKKKLKAVEKFRKTHEDTAAIKLDQAILQQLDTDSEAENSADYYDREPWPGVMRQNTSPAILSSDPIRKRPSNLAKDVIRKASLLDQVLLHASEPERMFFTALDDDLGKISRFYNGNQKRKSSFPFQLSDMGVARSRLKKAITEYYRSLELLKSYKELNFTGFQKILKKFDKTAGWKASTLYMQKLKKFHWVNTEDLEDVIEKTETLFINEFADGRPSDQGTPEKLPYMYYNLQIYACIALPILFALGFSVNLLVWTKSRINYKFIFELNPRDNLDYHEFAELPALMLLIVSFIVYLDFSQTLAPAVPSELCPLFLVILLLAIMLCPFSILYYSSRKWLGVALVTA